MQFKPSMLGGGRALTIQPYWLYQEGSKPKWVDGKVPEGYVSVGENEKGQPIWAPTNVAKLLAEAKVAKEEEERVAEEEYFADLERVAEKRARAPTRRRDFSKTEKERLAKIPVLLEREDRAPHSEEGDVDDHKKRRGAHLFARGLRTAGTADITATEQQDAKSTRKGYGNRISSKAPVKTGETDRSQTYGKHIIKIKARKLERARLRGKPDAQHVQVRRTEEILKELDAGPNLSSTGKPRGELKAYALKDREYHHRVDFFSAQDPEYYIFRSDS
jgi:hypothetical protein